MTLLNTAPAAYAGGELAQRIYAGGEQVWPADNGGGGGNTPPVGALWHTDYADFSKFQVTEWNNEPLAPVLVTRDGRNAGLYEIPGGGIRCEHVPEPSLTFTEGLDRWFSIGVMVEIPVTSLWSNAGFQWKNDGTGSPPIQLQTTDGIWAIGGGWGDAGEIPITKREFGPVVMGQWEDLIVHIVFSSTPANSLVEVWRDGTKVVSDYRPDGGTLYPGKNSYLKMGTYRSDSIAETGKVFIDRAAYGPTLESVTWT